MEPMLEAASALLSARHAQPATHSEAAASSIRKKRSAGLGEGTVASGRRSQTSGQGKSGQPKRKVKQQQAPQQPRGQAPSDQWSSATQELHTGVFATQQSLQYSAPHRLPQPSAHDHAPGGSFVVEQYDAMGVRLQTQMQPRLDKLQWRQQQQQPQFGARQQHHQQPHHPQASRPLTSHLAQQIPLRTSIQHHDIHQILERAEASPEFAKAMYAPQLQHPSHQLSGSEAFARRSVSAVIQPGRSIVPEPYQRQPNIIEVDPRLRGTAGMSSSLYVGDMVQTGSMLPSLRPLSTAGSAASTKNYRFPSPVFPSAGAQSVPHNLMWQHQREGPSQRHITHREMQNRALYRQLDKSPSMQPPHSTQQPQPTHNAHQSWAFNEQGVDFRASEARPQRQISFNIQQQHASFQPRQSEHFERSEFGDNSAGLSRAPQRTVMMNNPHPSSVTRAIENPVGQMLFNRAQPLYPKQAAFAPDQKFEDSLWSLAEDMSTAARDVDSSFQASKNVSSASERDVVVSMDPHARVIAMDTTSSAHALAVQEFKHIGGGKSFNAVSAVSSASFHGMNVSAVAVPKMHSKNHLRKIAKKSRRQERKDKTRTKSDKLSEQQSSDVHQRQLQIQARHTGQNGRVDKRKMSSHIGQSQKQEPQGTYRTAAGRKQPRNNASVEAKSMKQRDFEREQEKLIRGAHLAMLANQQLQQRNPVDFYSLIRPAPRVVAKSASSAVNPIKRPKLDRDAILPGQQKLGLPRSGVQGTALDVTETTSSTSGVQNRRSQTLLSSPAPLLDDEELIHQDARQGALVVGNYQAPDSDDRLAQQDVVPLSSVVNTQPRIARTIQSSELRQVPDARRRKRKLSNPFPVSSSPRMPDSTGSKDRGMNHVGSDERIGRASATNANSLTTERSPSSIVNQAVVSAAATITRPEPETVMIFCKRDFLRFQAGLLWRKFQEVKRKRDLTHATVTGRRARYRNARYQSFSHGEAAETTPGQEGVSTGAKERLKGRLRSDAATHSVEIDTVSEPDCDRSVGSNENSENFRNASQEIRVQVLANAIADATDGKTNPVQQDGSTFSQSDIVQEDAVIHLVQINSETSGIPDTAHHAQTESEPGNMIVRADSFSSSCVELQPQRVEELCLTVACGGELAGDDGEMVEAYHDLGADRINDNGVGVTDGGETSVWLLSGVTQRSEPGCLSVRATTPIIETYECATTTGYGEVEGVDSVLTEVKVEAIISSSSEVEEVERCSSGLSSPPVSERVRTEHTSTEICDLGDGGAIAPQMEAIEVLADIPHDSTGEEPRSFSTEEAVPVLAARDDEERAAEIASDETFSLLLSTPDTFSSTPLQNTKAVPANIPPSHTRGDLNDGSDSSGERVLHDPGPSEMATKDPAKPGSITAQDEAECAVPCRMNGALSYTQLDDEDVTFVTIEDDTFGDWNNTLAATSSESSESSDTITRDAELGTSRVDSTVPIPTSFGVSVSTGDTKMPLSKLETVPAAEDFSTIAKVATEPIDNLVSAVFAPGESTSVENKATTVAVRLAVTAIDRGEEIQPVES